LVLILSLWCQAQPREGVLDQNLLRSARVVSIQDIYESSLLTDGLGVHEGSDWAAQGGAIFQSSDAEALFDLGVAQLLTHAFIQADNNDAFLLEGSLDGSSWVSVWRAGVVSGAGVRLRSATFAPVRLRYLRLRAESNDDLVSVAEVGVFSRKPQIWPPQLPLGASGSRLLPAERRMGVGATHWILMWAVLFVVGCAVAAGWRLLRARCSIRESLAQIPAALQATYCTLDHRTLGLFRIALGAVLCWDLFQWISSFDLLLSDHGVLAPRDSLRADSPWKPFTLVRWCPSDGAVLISLLAAGVVYLAYMCGWYTRFAQVLALLCAVSIHNYAPVLTHSGHMMIRLLLVWSLFVPLGERFSIDALRKVRRGEALAPESFKSWVALLIPLQLSVNYLFNVLHKFAAPWLDGSFLSIIMQDTTLTTGLAGWVVRSAPPEVVTFATIGALIIEGGAPFLLLSPFYPRQCRLVALGALMTLHLSILLLMQLSVFSLAMCAGLVWMVPGDIAARIVRCGSRLFYGVHFTQVATEPDHAEQLAVSQGGWSMRILLTFFTVASVSQLIRENEPLSRWFPYAQPALLQAPLDALRTYQGWCMFATCGTNSYPSVHETVVLEERDKEGGRIDLLRSLFAGYTVPASSGVLDPPQRVVHERWRMYTRQLLSGHRGVERALRRWLRCWYGPADGVSGYVWYQPLLPYQAGRPPLVIRRRWPGVERIVAAPSEAEDFRCE
jgi:hypothetical protein